MCICGANDSALLNDACCHGNNCLQIIYIVTQMSKVHTPFLNTRFYLQMDDTEKITNFSLETPASLLPCTVDTTAKYSLQIKGHPCISGQ